VTPHFVLERVYFATSDSGFCASIIFNFSHSGRIMLKHRQALDQPHTACMNEQRRLDSTRWISKPLQHFSPAIDPIGVRTR
jgi:hypothetical protein